MLRDGEDQNVYLRRGWFSLVWVGSQFVSFLLLFDERENIN